MAAAPGSSALVDRSKGRKRLLILGGGTEQLIAAQIARTFGAEIVIFDGHERAPAMGFADHFVTVNIKDQEALLVAARQYAPDAVLVHAAELAIEAAQITEALGLAGLPSDVAVRGTDKSSRIACLSAAGVAVPGHALLPAEARFAAWQQQLQSAGIKGAFFIKPTHFAGAKGVVRLEDGPALQSYHKARGDWGCASFVAETVVEGEELSTESWLVDGRVVVSNIAHRHYDTTRHLLPFAIEDGHSMPHDQADHLLAEVNRVTEAAAQAIGVRDGIVKGDLIRTEDGQMVVIEMAVRSSGGRFADTVAPLATGVHLIHALVARCLDLPIDQDWLTKDRDVGVSQRFVMPPEGAPLARPASIRDLCLKPYVHDYWFREDLAQLTHVPPLRSHHDRLGYVICTGETRAEADNRARALVADIAARLTG